MKTPVEKHKPKGPLDYFALALTTCGVGYIPGAPGTYGSLVAVGGYAALRFCLLDPSSGEPSISALAGSVNGYLILGVAFVLLIAIGVWASQRSIPLLGNEDPSEAVIDEVMGQLLTLMFLPLNVSWWFVLWGFLLFRVFDILKPFPANKLQNLPGGLGICADDLAAGFYAGVCAAMIHTISLSI